MISLQTIANMLLSASLRTCLRSTSRRQARALNTTSTAFPDKLAFAFDIDGVLKQGKYVLPQAKRVLELLNGKNAYNRPVPHLLITNGGGVPDAERRKILSEELGQPIGKHQLVQSHTPIASYAHQYADQPVLIIGGPKNSCRRVAESYGLKHAFIPQDIIAWRPNLWSRTELTSEEWEFIKPYDFTDTQFKAILVLHDSHDWGRDVTLICELMSSRNGVLGTQRSRRDVALPPSEILPLVFSNPDLEWKSDYALSRFGMGAFRIAAEQIYKASTSLDLISTQYGKPHTSTYQFAEKMLRDHIASLGGKSDRELNVYMIGDNPESDIAGANAYGWNSCLLRTGVYESGTPTHEPTVIMDDVEKAVEWAIRREGGLV